MKQSNKYNEVFLKKCEDRVIIVNLNVQHNGDIIFATIFDNCKTPYHNESDCVHHDICKNILIDVLKNTEYSVGFEGINEAVIGGYLSSSTWFKGMKIIYDKIATAKENAFTEWHDKQAKRLAKLKTLYVKSKMTKNKNAQHYLN